MRQPLPGEPLWNLIDAVCSGSLDDEQVGELEERLKNDPTARELFADYCLLHAEIRFQVSAQGAVDSARKRIEALTTGATPSNDITQDVAATLRSHSNVGRPVRFQRHRRWRPLVAALVVVTFVCVAVVASRPWRNATSPATSKRTDSNELEKLRSLVDRNVPQEPATVEVDGFAGQLTGTFHAKWEDATTAPFVRQYLHVNQQLQLREGMAELRLYGGTKLVLEGPCRFVVRSRNSGTLERGRILAGNDGRAAGFQVKTPRAIVIDLGAQFGVEVDESGDTQVHVLDGVVQTALVNGAKPPAKSIHIVTNESLLIRAKDGVTTKGVAELQRFARVIPQAEDRLVDLLRESVITHYAFDDSQNLGRNAGRGRDGAPRLGLRATRGIPSLGQAGDFGGDDLRSIDVATEDVAVFSPEGQGLTVAAWVKTTCIDQRGNVFFAYNSPAENADTHRDIVLLELEFGGLPNALVRDDDYGREINLVHHQGVADGKWHHVALTLSLGKEKTLNLYVDGELSSTSSSRVVNDVLLRRARIGRRLCEKPQDDNDFQGLIDELLILNRALKPSELRWLVDSTKPDWI